MKIVDDREDFKIIATYTKDGKELEITLPYKVNPSDYSLNIKMTRETLEDLISMVNTGTI